jgi:formylglycine-generating enzyme required for sulfatase activity
MRETINDGYGEYVLVPAGEFLMGDNFNEGDGSEKPVHTINLPDYYIGKYEVTNGEYKKFMDDGGYTNPAYWTTEEWDRASSEEEKDQRKNPYGNVPEHSYGRQPEYWNDPVIKGGGIPGNVWEWVSDRWDPDYYSRSSVDNPAGPAPGDSIHYDRGPTYGDYIASIRGGFFIDNKGEMMMITLRSSQRGMVFNGPRRRGFNGGFRCVREAD